MYDDSPTGLSATVNANSDFVSMYLPAGATSSLMATTTTTTNAGDMKLHLQNLLDSKEKQLQQAATLGQRVLAQRVELEERIRQLQEMDADKPDEEEIDFEARERYRELAEAIDAWDADNSALSSAFVVGKVSTPLVSGLFRPCQTFSIFQIFLLVLSIAFFLNGHRVFVS
jgi:hypothetical protein